MYALGRVFYITGVLFLLVAFAYFLAVMIIVVPVVVLPIAFSTDLGESFTAAEMVSPSGFQKEALAEEVHKKD